MAAATAAAAAAAAARRIRDAAAAGGRGGGRDVSRVFEGVMLPMLGVCVGVLICFISLDFMCPVAVSVSGAHRQSPYISPPPTTIAHAHTAPYARMICANLGDL